MIFHKILDDIYYLPVHMNVIQWILLKEPLSKDKIFRRYVLSKELFTNIAVNFEKEFQTNEKIIIDFRYIYSAEDRTFQCLNTLYKKGLYIILLNLTTDMKARILNNDCKSYSVSFDINGIEAVLINRDGLTIDATLYKEDFNYNIDRALISQYIARPMQALAIEKLQYMHSSNLYCNKYINIKDMFAHNSFFIVIYMMCNVYQKYFNERIDGLVCASNNGAILASIMGVLLDLDVVYLRNLGPNIKLRDKHLLDHIASGKKYLYIFDFICTGAEYKLVKTIVKIKNSDIIGGIGVSKYLELVQESDDNLENRSIKTLYDIKDYKEFDYKLIIEKEN